VVDFGGQLSVLLGDLGSQRCKGCIFMGLVLAKGFVSGGKHAAADSLFCWVDVFDYHGESFTANCAIFFIVYAWIAVTFLIFHCFIFPFTMKHLMPNLSEFSVH
jgi:hypothetical protein